MNSMGDLETVCAYMKTLAMHDDLIPTRFLNEMKNLEHDPLDNWFACLELVRAVWDQLKGSNETLCAGYRAAGEEGDKEHLDSVMHRLSSTWRLRDHMLGRIDDEESRLSGHFGDYRDMALFILLVVRAEELELEGLRMTRLVRSKYGEEGLPKLESWLGGERSVAWWLRECMLGDVY